MKKQLNNKFEEQNIKKTIDHNLDLRKANSNMQDKNRSSKAIKVPHNIK